MKLVEIKDTRIGQVRIAQIVDYNDEETRGANIVITSSCFGDHGDEYDYRVEIFDQNTGKPLKHQTDCHVEDEGAVIGKIGITHKIEDNKLIELPREPIQRDDVIAFGDGGVAIVLWLYQTISRDIRVNLYHDCNKPFPHECKVLGIYGVTHEFINDCEEE